MGPQRPTALQRDGRWLNLTKDGLHKAGETLAYANRVAETPRFGNRQVKFSINNQQDGMGFTTFADSAYQTYFINSIIRDDPLVGPSGERRMAGVAHAKELLKRGTPATPLADPGGVA